MLQFKSFLSGNAMAFVVLLVIFTVHSESSQGAVFYVATTGSNSAECGPSANPCKSVSYAYDKVVAGDTILVKPGVYAGDFNHTYSTGEKALRLNKNGTAIQPITLRSETKWAAVLDGQNDSLMGSTLYLTGTYHVIQGFKITGGYKEGINIYGSSNRIIENEIANNANKGDATVRLGFDGIFSSQSTSGNHYIGNYIHHNGRRFCKDATTPCNLDHGLYLCGDDEIVANNIVTHNWGGNGLQVAGYLTVAGMKVVNNVFAFNGRSGAVIWRDLLNIEIKNNIFYENHQQGIGFYNPTGSGVVIDRNIFFGNGSGAINTAYADAALNFTYSMGVNDLNLDPLFVFSGDPGLVANALYYKLQSSSRAIDRGALIPGIITDFSGVPRPQGSAFDIGAFEYGTETPDTTSPIVAILSPQSGAVISR